MPPSRQFSTVSTFPSTSRRFRYFLGWFKMKCSTNATKWLSFVLLVLCVAAWPFDRAYAQGVTTGAITGLVKDAQQNPVSGASVVAIHIPSGSVYEGTTRADGRFSIPGMRVGGPYSVTVSYTG